MPRFVRSHHVAAMLMLMAAAQMPRVAGQWECYENFMDAISAGNTWITQQGLNIAGYSNKLPSPDIGVAILAPTNGAWLRFFWNNGLFLRQLSGLGDKLTAVVTFHVVPTALTPEMLQGPEGTSPTLYGLLSGLPANLKHWLKDDGVQFLFQGPWDPKVAGAVDVKQVCPSCSSGDPSQTCSWVYIVDEVLKPAYDLSDVLTVQIPDSLNLGGGGPAPASPAPASPVPASPPAAGPVPSNPAPSTPASPACDKTFAQVAEQTGGLTILKTMLSQPQYAAALPSPAYDYTVFAPSDNAFFAFLSAFNLSITDALALGDRLNSVLLYHVVPGALTPDQLAKQTQLTTGLAIKTNNGDFTLGVANADGATTVSGKYPGNTAKVQSNVGVCASQVYVIDQLLIPAASLDAIPTTNGGLPPPTTPAPAAAPSAPPTVAATPPAAGPAPSNPAPSPAASAEFAGVALATGYLANCSVTLSGSSGSQAATTDGTGRFSFACGGDCTELGATVTLPAAGQAAGCADSLTQLPPPFDLQAPVAALPAGASLAALSPLTTIIAAAAAQQAQQAAAAPSPAAVANRRLLADAPAPAPDQQQQQQPLFGITEGGSAAGTSYGDPLAAALTGDQDAYNLLSKNQELMCTGSITGALLSGLVGGGATPVAGAAALFDELARDLLAGSPFNLSSQESVQSLLDRSYTSLAGATEGATPPAGVDRAAVEQAATQTLVLLNSLLQQAVDTAKENQLAEADKMVTVLARLAKICQVNVAPAATQLAAGSLSVDAWQQQFSLDAIRNLAVSA
ncbi:hypothetical protein ABPG77_004398 [Micractinium sp. CCAP 211/92]